MSTWQPKPMGPSFRWVSQSELTLTSGPEAGKTCRLVLDRTESLLEGRLSLGDRTVGRVQVERRPALKTFKLLDIVVPPESRHGGWGALLLHLAFRALLLDADELRGVHIGKVMKPTLERDVIENVGMGILARRLGFVPVLDADRVLVPANVTDLSIIPPGPDSPPGYRLSLKTEPLVLLVVRTDDDTGKPLTDFAAYRRLVKLDDIRRWIKEGSPLLGNVDHTLPRSGASKFTDYIAENAEERTRFLKALETLPRP